MEHQLAQGAPDALQGTLISSVGTRSATGAQSGSGSTKSAKGHLTSLEGTRLAQGRISEELRGTKSVRGPRSAEWVVQRLEDTKLTTRAQASQWFISTHGRGPDQLRGTSSPYRGTRYAQRGCTGSVGTMSAQGHQTSSDGMLSSRNRVSDQLRVHEISLGDIELAQGVNISSMGTRLRH